VNAQKMFYERCKVAASGWAPDAQLRFVRPTYVGPEIDQWLDSPTNWEVMSILGRREDFTMLSEEGQRLFLLFAGEALYGPNADEALRIECERIASEPI
jgi:hypothetical protein